MLFLDALSLRDVVREDQTKPPAGYDSCHGVRCTDEVEFGDVPLAPEAFWE